MRFVSILRGINVSGHKKIKMTDLAALYESLGLTNVETYIQSGNVAFDTSARIGLAGKIEKAIEKKYNFIVPVIALNKKELEKTVKGNPFLKKPGVDPRKLHATFLENDPAKNIVRAFCPPSSGQDECVVKGSVVYLYCPDGYGRTKFTNTFLEKKLEVRATTRNWKSVNKLLQMADD